MILPKEKLKGFLYFSSDNFVMREKGYTKTYYTVVKIHRKKRFLLIPYEGVDSYEFLCFKDEGKVKVTNSALTLLEQLEEVEKEQWFALDKESYFRLKEKFPEEFV